MCTSRCQKVKRIGSREHTGSQDRRVSVSSPERTKYQRLWSKKILTHLRPIDHLVVPFDGGDHTREINLWFFLRQNADLSNLNISDFLPQMSPCSWRPLFGQALQSCWTSRHHQSSEDRTSWLKDSICVTNERLRPKLGTICFLEMCLIWILLLPMRKCVLIWYAGLFMSKHFPTTGKVCCHIYTLLRRSMKQ